MKTQFWIILLISTVLSLGAEEEYSIPRRIRFDLEIQKSTPVFFTMTPEILFAEIARRNTIIPTEDKVGRIDIISIKSVGTSLSFTLDAEGSAPVVKSYPLSELVELENLESACREVAEAWAPYLGLVKPEVQELVVRQERQMNEEIAFERSLASPFQMVLWSPNYRTKPFTNVSSSAKSLGLTPLVFDFQWFFKSNIGLTASIYLEYSSFYQLGGLNTSEINLLLFPGTGIVFRTIGKLSGEFAVNFYTGPARMIAGEDMAEYGLLNGDVVGTWLSMWDAHFAMSWNFTNQFSIRLKTGILALVDSKWGNNNFEPIVLLQLGAGYRW